MYCCCSFHHCAPSLQTEVEASSGEQEYSADFESTTTASTVSMPSAPSTPRDTPPLEGGAGEEVPEKEGVADDTEAVTPVMTPRPTSEEEEVGGEVVWSGVCEDCNIRTVCVMRPCS